MIIAALPGTPANGALDVLARHVVRLRFRDDRAEARVHIRVAAARAGGNGQLFDQARENLAALGVGSAFLVLDGMPLGMAGHGGNSRK
jgi:hypothetical protein